MQKIKEIIKNINSLDIGFLNETKEYQVHVFSHSGKCNIYNDKMLENIIDLLYEEFCEIAPKLSRAEAHAPMNATCEKCGRIYCDHENKY